MLQEQLRLMQIELEESRKHNRERRDNQQLGSGRWAEMLVPTVRDSYV